jgi:hypothetical protein
MLSMANSSSKFLQNMAYVKTKGIENALELECLPECNKRLLALFLMHVTVSIGKKQCHLNILR